MQIPLILDDQSNPELIVGDLTALSRMVKKKDREKFWLALALAWIRAMPRLEHYLDDRVPEKERLLGDDHAFRNYLRSELSNRLVMLF